MIERGSIAQFGQLLLEKDQRVLDIGCGWGGLALYAAEFCRAQVTGITPVAGAARGGRRPRARTPPPRHDGVPDPLAKRQGVVPTTRDYITQAEACLRGLEHRRRAPLRLAGE